MTEIILNFLPFLIIVAVLYMAYGRQPSADYERTGWKLGPFWRERGRFYDDRR